jgi:hypothetical protein
MRPIHREEPSGEHQTESEESYPELARMHRRPNASGVHCPTVSRTGIDFNSLDGAENAMDAETRAK